MESNRYLFRFSICLHTTFLTFGHHVCISYSYAHRHIYHLVTFKDPCHVFGYSAYVERFVYGLQLGCHFRTADFFHHLFNILLMEPKGFKMNTRILNHFKLQTSCPNRLWEFQPNKQAFFWDKILHGVLKLILEISSRLGSNKPRDLCWCGSLAPLPK